MSMISNLILRVHFWWIDRAVERLPARITAQREKLARLKEARTRLVRKHLTAMARRSA